MTLLLLYIKWLTIQAPGWAEPAQLGVATSVIGCQSTHSRTLFHQLLLHQFLKILGGHFLPLLTVLLNFLAHSPSVNRSLISFVLLLWTFVCAGGWQWREQQKEKGKLLAKNISSFPAKDGWSSVWAFREASEGPCYGFFFFARRSSSNSLVYSSSWRVSSDLTTMYIVSVHMFAHPTLH